jgi:ribosomal protein S18 acetylase RimI-like enzyme
MLAPEMSSATRPPGGGDTAMIEVRSLEGMSWERLASAFTAAFSDYAVPMAMSASALEAMQRRRGYAAAASFGAFVGEELVAFALTCRDGDRAYNSGTGVLPSARRAGLARQMIEAVIATLSASTSSYVLEVIESNRAAIALYERVGFAVARRLQCWAMPPAAAAAAPAAMARLPELPASRLEELAAHRDLEPSWQNSLASLKRATEPWLVLGEERGAVAIVPGRGDVPFLCVRREARRLGLGGRLLRAAAAVAAQPLRILNVDERDAGVAAFLASQGATRTVCQLEMVWRR